MFGSCFHVSLLYGVVVLSGASSYTKRFVLPVFHMMEVRDKHSATGTRARVAQVRAEYPSQLDYSGDAEWPGSSLESTSNR